MDAKQEAQEGLALIKEAILETLQVHPGGFTNAEIADLLDLRSDYLGGQKDYLPWSVLGLLLNEKQICRNGRRTSFCGNEAPLTVCALGWRASSGSFHSHFCSYNSGE